MMKKWLLRMLDKLISRIVSRGMPLVIKNYNSMYSQKWHPHNAMRDEALAETVAYIKASMGSAMIKTDQIDVLTYASQNACLDGLVLEFGVRTGTRVVKIPITQKELLVHCPDDTGQYPRPIHKITHRRLLVISQL